jgi:hypothetical protein
MLSGHPDTPFNCTLLNQTTESLEVDCVEGFDGGQPQYFLLEVFDMQTGMLQANISSKFPLFSVTGLGPGMVLKMLVYAANSKGKSEPAIVEGFTLKVAEKQTGEPRHIFVDTHASGGIRTHNPSNRAAADPRLRPRSHWDQLMNISTEN